MEAIVPICIAAVCGVSHNAKIELTARCLRAEVKTHALRGTCYDNPRKGRRPPGLLAQHLFDQTCELADIANGEHPAMLLDQAGAGEIVEFPRHSFAVGAYATCDFRMR